MTWLKLDETFDDDVADAGLSKDARWAHLQGLLHCMRRLTDGRLTDRVVTKFDVDDPDACARELCDAGFWVRRPGGYLVVHHMEWQPTRQDVEDRKAANAARQAKARRKKADDARTRASEGVTRDVTRDETRDAQSVTTDRVGAERNGSGREEPPAEDSERSGDVWSTVPSPRPVPSLPSGGCGWCAGAGCPQCDPEDYG